jgi:hypothetical protein
LIFESLLNSAENFIRDLKTSVFEIRNNEVSSLKEKVLGLHKQLQEEIKDEKFDLIEKKESSFLLFNQSR